MNISMLEVHDSVACPSSKWVMILLFILRLHSYCQREGGTSLKLELDLALQLVDLLSDVAEMRYELVQHLVHKASENKALLSHESSYKFE
uniref:Uncharacterized protein n=1 Tax=Cucumis melo TaxID=3656 RepID=A0A9I9EFL6_CUCME